jgi:hypothetical protein
MANEIRYEVIGKDGGGNLLVRYSLGENSMDLGIPWAGEGDLDEFIKRYAPRHNLKQMAAQIDHDALKGRTGAADLELTDTTDKPAP